MSDRTRFEAQIKHYDTFRGREFETALYDTIRGYGGLSFFTDEQIEEIRAAMVKNEWTDRCRRREMQARNAARMEGAA